MELKITTRKGIVFTVLYDEADHEKIMKQTWHVSQVSRPYVRTRLVRNGWFKEVCLHNYLFDNTEGEFLVDHIDGNTLNNRRNNLRKADKQQNAANRRPFGKSKYLGVAFSTGRNKWQAQIGANGHYKHLGRFNTEEDAARAYDKAAKEAYGEFANLNFP